MAADDPYGWSLSGRRYDRYWIQAADELPEGWGLIKAGGSGGPTVRPPGDAKPGRHKNRVVA